MFELLLEVCPSLLFVTDRNGAVPYHLLQSRADLYQDLLVTCVRLSLAVDQTTGRPTDPAAHQYCWHHYLANFSVGVEALLDEFQPRVLELSEQLDANGRRAVDVASLRNRQLIMKRIYYHGLFNIKLGPAEHMSATCKLHFAVQVTEDGSRNVAMKFMKNRNQFLAELSFRRDQSLDPKYVMGVVCSFDSDSDPEYRQEAVRRGFAEYPYLVVMDAADRNFQAILMHEQLLEKLPLVKTYFTFVVKSVMHMHSKGLIHTDLKRNNIVVVYC